jgi:2,3-bisphosphoglycerate-dependent phosphoglycerate mutase
MPEPSATAMPLTRLIIIRHGETDWNAEHRIQGNTDIPLNKKGIAQAEALSERLSDAPIGAIFSSDLSRAVKTAEIIRRRIPGASHAVTPRLRERNWGALEGKTREEIKSEFPMDAAAIFSPDHVPAGGESRLDFIKRIDGLIDSIAADRAGETSIAVTHGGVCAIVLKSIMGIDVLRRTPFNIDNCSVNIACRLEDGFWTIETLNCIAHLQALGLA